MLTIILLFIYISSILAVIFIERKNPTEALLWVFIMICIPFLGTVLYLIFGDTISIKLTTYIRSKRLALLKERKLIEDLNIDLNNLSSVDKKLINFNRNYNNSKLTSYEDINIYTSGKTHYEALFKDIKEAKETIYIEFYTIHNDIMGKALVHTLCEKAKEGLDIYVMCDFIANISTPYKMFKPLIELGGKVIRLKPYFTHFRSHRKIVVIDHKIAYIGGMNIGKQYANLADKKNPWRDTQVRMKGACALVLEDAFLIDWFIAIKKKDIDYYVNKLKYRKVNSYNNTNKLCQFVRGGVDNNLEAVKMVYLSMISAAKHSIKIQSPYFIPDSSILDALKVALASGVQVELMIPGIKASFFLDPVTNYYAHELLKYGAKVYKYKGYIHAKTMVIDEEMCDIGSVNMDMRSLKVDDEICGIFYHNEIVLKYIQIYKNDINNCHLYTLDDYENRTLYEKFKEGFFLLFAPLM